MHRTFLYRARFRHWLTAASFGKHFRRVLEAGCLRKFPFNLKM